MYKASIPVQFSINYSLLFRMRLLALTMEEQFLTCSAWTISPPSHQATQHVFGMIAEGFYSP
jgi:hypothetical protein